MNKTSHQVRADIAAVEAERAELARQGAEAYLAAGQTALTTHRRRVVELDVEAEALREALKLAEEREAQQARARRVALCEAACDALLEEALNVPAAARELEQAVATLGEKLARLQELRERMGAAAQVAIAHANLHNGADLLIGSEIAMSALVDPFARQLERAGLGAV